MTLAYDVELVRRWCDALAAAAKTLSAHAGIPDWLRHRLSLAASEAASLKGAIDDEWVKEGYAKMEAAFAKGNYTDITNEAY